VTQTSEESDADMYAIDGQDSVGNSSRGCHCNEQKG